MTWFKSNYTRVCIRKTRFDMIERDTVPYTNTIELIDIYMYKGVLTCAMTVCTLCVGWAIVWVDDCVRACGRSLIGVRAWPVGVHETFVPVKGFRRLTGDYDGYRDIRGGRGCRTTAVKYCFFRLCEPETGLLCAKISKR